MQKEKVILIAVGLFGLGGLAWLMSQKPNVAAPAPTPGLTPTNALIPVVAGAGAILANIFGTKSDSSVIPPGTQVNIPAPSSSVTYAPVADFTFTKYFIDNGIEPMDGSPYSYARFVNMCTAWNWPVHTFEYFTAAMNRPTMDDPSDPKYLLVIATMTQEMEAAGTIPDGNAIYALAPESKIALYQLNLLV